MRKKILIVGLFLLAAVLLSGCVGATAWPGLSASGDAAYLANTTAVHAVNLKTGEEMWKFTASGGFLGSNPSLFVTNPVLTEDGSLIVLDSGNKRVMYALDLNKMDVEEKRPVIRWEFSDAEGHWIAAPLILGNRLFAPNADGNLYVLNLQDGKKAEEPIRLSGKENQTDRLWAQPVTDGERLFVTSLDHRIFAISLETYEVLWSQQLDAAIPGAPVLGADGMLYVGSFAKKLEQFDPVSGEHKSVLDTNDWVWGTPIVDGDNLYFGDVQGYFYSYNTKEARLNWEPVKLDGAIAASPLILGDRLLVATELGDVYAVDRNGAAEVWYHPDKEGKAYTTPVLAGEYVLAAYLESDYYLVILNTEGIVQRTFPQ